VEVQVEGQGELVIQQHAVRVCHLDAQGGSGSAAGAGHLQRNIVIIQHLRLLLCLVFMCRLYRFKGWQGFCYRGQRICARMQMLRVGQNHIYTVYIRYF